jgi:cholesterol oxidase
MADEKTEEFDVCVIGSGFGGSVMAARLAGAGLGVCVLERGKSYPPGSFPRSPHQMESNFWDPSAGLFGLYNIWSFSELDSVVASGLGGGSLIYGNVLLRKDERWFVQESPGQGDYERWPVTRADLEEHYDRVEKSLQAQRYPFENPPYDTPKTRAMQAGAAVLGLEWILPNLAITFANQGEPPVPGEPIREQYPNLHGRTRYTCRLVGECCIGCNYGSKNSLDYTYLSDALRSGAEIRTLCEVRALEPAREGYLVTYVRHDPTRERIAMDTHRPEVLPLHRIQSRRVVLAGGTFGTNFLLLRNREALPRISATLGTRFCSNGDFSCFAVMRARRGTSRLGPRLIEAERGPVITSAIRIPDRLDGGEGRGFYIEDLGYPQFVGWILHTVAATGSLASWRSILTLLSRRLFGRTPDANLDAELARVLGASKLAASILPMIGMGREAPTGTITLDASHRLVVDWREQRSKQFFDRMRSKMRDLAGALSADYLDNPTWYIGRSLTMHPLGGCPMGRDEVEGVVDSYGRVFNYPGLYVADGSVMPGPVGPNPSLTIAALADRFADHLLAEDGRS